MSSTSSLFKIEEHTISTAHIREYSRATANGEEDVLQLAIKQYTPRESASESDQEVTVIGAHANGFPKVGVTSDRRPGGQWLTRICTGAV